MEIFLVTSCYRNGDKLACRFYVSCTILCIKGQSCDFELIKVKFDTLLISTLVVLVKSCFSILYQVSNTEHIEDQRLAEKNHTVQNSSPNTRQKHFSLTRKYSEGTELAELLAEHQERQLRSMQGLNVGMQRQWGSSSRLNDLHVQTNTITSGLSTRYMEQIPLNNGTLKPANTAYSVASKGNPAQVVHTGNKHL